MLKFSMSIRVGMYWPYIYVKKFEVTSYKFEVTSLKLQVGSWKLEVGRGAIQ